MTKRIRIENADTSDHKVVVEVWEKSTDKPDALISSYDLSAPCQLAHELIYSNRYLVIKEV